MDRLNQALLASVTIFQTICLVYNVLLLFATYNNRHSKYLTIFGSEATIGSTFSYLNSIVISVLMTINRLAVVIKPFNSWFSRTRVFIYCGLIALVIFISLLIPYFSPCYITFMLNRLSFVSACAPNRHQITTFQNKYAIFIPLFCMVINLGIIIYLRLARDETYSKIKRWFRKSGDVMIISLPKPKPNALSKLRSRRDFVMMRQTISVAVFLSIYEVGGFITKVFPDEYAQLPELIRDGYFYFRMESIAFMNIFIYYLETPNTRQMLRKYLNINTDQNSVSVASVAFRV